MKTKIVCDEGQMMVIFHVHSCHKIFLVQEKWYNIYLGVFDLSNDI